MALTRQGVEKVLRVKMCSLLGPELIVLKNSKIRLSPSSLKWAIGVALAK